MGMMCSHYSAYQNLKAFLGTISINAQRSASCCRDCDLSVLDLFSADIFFVILNSPLYWPFLFNALQYIKLNYAKLSHQSERKL